VDNETEKFTLVWSHERRDAEGRMLRWVEQMEVPGKRKAGRSKKTCRDTMGRKHMLSYR